MVKLLTEVTMLPSTKNKFIQIRDLEPDDHAFLFSTYLKHNWYDKTNTSTLKKATWMAMQHKRLEKVLSGQTVKIACLSEDPDTIVGYAFKDGEKPFVYAKLAWRSPALNLETLLINSLEKP